jgi:hypothetical protein
LLFERAGTTLSDDINKYFYVLSGSLWSRSLNLIIALCMLFLHRITDTLNSQNIDLSSWDTLYVPSPFT